MKAGIRLISLTTLLASAPLAASAEWQAVETVKSYAIAGQTGAELYFSIGERGPEAGGMGRAIAHTNFKLTWTRKYEPQGDSCVLVTARPKLVITYTLPKPAKPLQGSVKRNWETFITGVRRHELVHGEMIKAMVKQIETVSVGLSVPDDPGCRKIRAELTRRLGEISQEQRRQSRDFDRAELSKGGNIHRLVLDLVNGD
ncbi:DUF922 domain-containing protein [Sinorhizobium sp. BG8]|uniref:DUF922 domain-containing Zn-dependent protease n=1 Tax=Sinorhizobium sp. BG8 TaxID=2613773 RepID=UPI00193E5102|nr:DUF922 domain-containing protein [Sinorhizobium sp. BG8]QRM53213.1 DUF922 domain-containing protein [Sinorhizobium sp. BG8]